MYIPVIPEYLDISRISRLSDTRLLSKNTIINPIGFILLWEKRDLLDVYPCDPRAFGYNSYSLHFRCLSSIKESWLNLSHIYFKSKRIKKDLLDVYTYDPQVFGYKPYNLPFEYSSSIWKQLQLIKPTFSASAWLIFFS